MKLISQIEDLLLAVENQRGGAKNRKKTFLQSPGNWRMCCKKRNSGKDKAASSLDGLIPQKVHFEWRPRTDLSKGSRCSGVNLCSVAGNLCQDNDRNQTLGTH